MPMKVQIKIGQLKKFHSDHYEISVSQFFTIDGDLLCVSNILNHCHN